MFELLTHCYLYMLIGLCVGKWVTIGHDSNVSSTPRHCLIQYWFIPNEIKILNLLTFWCFYSINCFQTYRLHGRRHVSSGLDLLMAVVWQICCNQGSPSRQSYECQAAFSGPVRASDLWSSSEWTTIVSKWGRHVIRNAPCSLADDKLSRAVLSREKLPCKCFVV